MNNLRFSKFIVVFGYLVEVLFSKQANKTKIHIQKKSDKYLRI